MSLYDDFDTRERAEKVAGWSSGIKLLQSQLQLKKATITQPKKDILRKMTKVLAPVIDLKSRRDEEDTFIPTDNTPKLTPATEQSIIIATPCSELNIDYNLDIVDEYNPLIPNEYDKVVKELRDHKEKEKGNDYRFEDGDRDNRKSYKKRRTRFEENYGNENEARSGFGSHNDLSDEESPPRQSRSDVVRNSGAQIAPPASLLESVNDNGINMPRDERPSFGAPYGTSSVAAKIMAKYGFKEGQGLGKSQQGMSMALQVEKTSKRGGRIIHEKEMSAVMPPPSLALSQLESNSPPVTPTPAICPTKPEPTITEIMKCPSKVVLLRNMVGPGDVDADLEPEVADECNGKYGDVIKVLIHELPGALPEEAVRIFVEFKRIESAIKAVVDLNGRFFGGRQVRAGFYSCESFASLRLLE